MSAPMETNLGLSLMYGADHSHTTTDQPIVDIVAVHGLNGHPLRTWTNPELGTSWLQSLLPVDIPNARILSFGYDSSLSSFSSRTSITEAAGSLLKGLTTLRNSGQEHGNRPLILIGHSLGGIIVQQALIQSRQSLPNSQQVIEATIGCIFLATPHRSNNLHDTLKVLLYSFPTLRGRQKAQASALGLSVLNQLLDMQPRFNDLHDQQSFRCVSFFEDSPLPGFGLVVDEPLNSSSWHTQLPLHANHHNICKFKSRSEPNYQLFLGELKRLLPPIPRLSSSRFDYPSHQYLRCLQSGNGSDRVPNPALGTCEWILAHQEFTSWMNGQNSILWISGSPGSGKSTLSKFISRRLAEQSTGPQETLIVSFFFWSTPDTESASIRLLRSVLYQILSECATDLENLVSMELNPKIRSNFANNHLMLSSSVTPAFILGLIKEALLRISRYRSVFIVIDALDECTEGELAAIVSILSFVDSSTLSNAVRLCLTSRPDPKMNVVSNHFKIQKINLEDLNKADIERYIEFHINGVVRCTQLKQNIIKLITERARGTFLWVALVLDILKQEARLDISSNDVLELSISRIPKTVDGIYHTLLDQITHKSSQSYSVEILSWVCLAQRPLSVAEMRQALAIKDSSNLWDCGADLSSPHISDNQGFPLLECGSFIKVEKLSNTVQIIHQSAREFLLREAPWKPHHIEAPQSGYPESFHDWIAAACLTYINFSYLTEIGSIKANCPEKRNDGFLQYAVLYWTKHLKLADVPNIPHPTILKLLNWPSTDLLRYWAHLHRNEFGNHTSSEYWGWTPLHVSAAFGIHSMALAILDTKDFSLARYDIRDANGLTPLSLAAKHGNLELARLLLKAGANPNTTDLRYGFSPLQWAALEGCSSVVELLLEKGADIHANSRNPSGTALVAAAARGHRQTVEILLEHGANMDSRCFKGGWTALALSAVYGHRAIVELLIKSGACINAGDACAQQTPLWYATAGGHHDVVKLILDHGGSVALGERTNTSDQSMSWADRVAYSFTKHTAQNTDSTRRECASGTAGHTSCPSRKAEAAQTDNQSRTGTKKRSREVPDPEDGDNDGSPNDPNKRPTLNPKPSASSKELILRLACPYFKFDPQRYGAPSRCAGPAGWPNMNRLKEHLYKKHFVYLCQKCNFQAENEDDLRKHYNSTKPCSARLNRNYGDGFDEGQKQKLKLRNSKRAAGGNVLEYWEWVYQVLFPGAKSPVAITPFYEEKSLDKKSYDDLCALRRSQCPNLRMGIMQVIYDPQNPDPVGTIMALVDNHQSDSVSLPVSGVNARIGPSTQNTQPDIQTPELDFSQLPFGGPNLAQIISSQIANPYDTQQQQSEPDSGFYSNLIAERCSEPSASQQLHHPESIVMQSAAEDQASWFPPAMRTAVEPDVVQPPVMQGLDGSELDSDFETWYRMNVGDLGSSQ